MKAIENCGSIYFTRGCLQWTELLGQADWSPLSEYYFDNIQDF